MSLPLLPPPSFSPPLPPPSSLLLSSPIPLPPPVFTLSEKPPSKPPEKQVERARVLFDYAAEQPDELTIKVGEVLEVVSKDLDGQEGWWEVRSMCVSGLVYNEMEIAAVGSLY